MILSIAIGIGATILVYLALMGSLEQPTINRIPIPPEAAISIVIAQNKSMHLSPKDFVVSYVYIKGNGEFYESNVTSNSIGQYRGTAPSTISGASHFAWRVQNKNDGSTFFVDNIDGDIISKSG